VVVRLDARLRRRVESRQAALKGEESRLEGLQADWRTAEAEWAGQGTVRFQGHEPSRLDGARPTCSGPRACTAASTRSEMPATIARGQEEPGALHHPVLHRRRVTKLNNEVGEQVLGTFNNAAP